MMIVVDVPIKVVSENNQREHWSKGHARHKSQKNLITYLLLCNKIPKTLPVTITFIRKGIQQMDSDNLQGAFKYIRDAVAEYFFPEKKAGRADDNKGFIWQYAQIKEKAASCSILFEYSQDKSSEEKT